MRPDSPDREKKGDPPNFGRAPDSRLPNPRVLAPVVAAEAEEAEPGRRPSPGSPIHPGMSASPEVEAGRRRAAGGGGGGGADAPSKGAAKDERESSVVHQVGPRCRAARPACTAAASWSPRWSGSCACTPIFIVGVTVVERRSV